MALTNELFDLLITKTLCQECRQNFSLAAIIPVEIRQDAFKETVTLRLIKVTTKALFDNFNLRCCIQLAVIAPITNGSRAT